MRRKILKDYANTLCQMLVGWRMADDLDVLAELPDGMLSLDVKQGTAQHSETGSLTLWVAQELQAWLSEQLLRSNIPCDSIASAVVRAEINTNRIPTKKNTIVSFDFRVTSNIETDEASYHGHLCEKHTWHMR